MITKDAVAKAKSLAPTPLRQERIVGYLGKAQISNSLEEPRLPCGDLIDRQGNTLGVYEITCTWHVGRHKDPLHQVRVVVNGVTYTGRSQGIGYIFRGRRIKS